MRFIKPQYNIFDRYLSSRWLFFFSPNNLFRQLSRSLRRGGARLLEEAKLLTMNTPTDRRQHFLGGNAFHGLGLQFCKAHTPIIVWIAEWSKA